jgi:tetratricopeptide (TPR) repeat protein
LGDQPALAARILAARALRAMGELPRASSELQGALAEAAEDDPAYAEALFELALLQAATQKLRGARRTLDELLDLAPDFRPADLAALRRALELVG